MIILTTLSGFLTYKTIRTCYKKKYIFDYRDASHERYPILRKIFRNIIDSSYFTCISSKGFLYILPEGNYVISHNFSYHDIHNNLKEICNINNKPPFKVSYIGLLRETKYMKLLIDIFGNDERFILNINGGGDNYNELKEYAKKYTNVFLTGNYLPHEKKRFIEDSDILCYNYLSSYVNDYALANKYYDGLIYKKPMLGNIKTYSGRVIMEKGLGISLDFEDKEYKDKIYNFLLNFSPEDFCNNARKELEGILKEDTFYMKKIEDFLNA